MPKKAKYVKVEIKTISDMIVECDKVIGGDPLSVEAVLVDIRGRLETIRSGPAAKKVADVLKNIPEIENLPADQKAKVQAGLMKGLGFNT